MPLFLIDGYNLMHAAGFLAPNRPKGRLKAARTRLLDWLADSTRGRGALSLVVFDAADAPAPSADTTHRGIAVRFAYRQTADDAIEQSLRGTGSGAVVVVSNDGRLLESARRAGARAWSCERFMDWLTTGEVTPTPRPPDPPEKPDAPAGDDPELLAAFGGRRQT